MEIKEIVKANLRALREKAPLVHNITNYVAMNNTANALLALGASPIMAHTPEEVEDLSAISSSLVINIGTLSPPWIKGMKSAMERAAEVGKPIVLDPVGAGATTFRSDTARSLIETALPKVLRGNASEILALKKGTVKTRGVDSTATVEEAKESADLLARELGCVVCVSGPEDYISDGRRNRRIKNGSRMMAKVTGMGCTATALTGAFVAVEPDPLQAAVCAMAVMGIAGEMAAKKAKGPGTLQFHFFDALYTLGIEDIELSLRAE